MNTNKKPRKICVVTGTRADYGILFPVMRAIESSGDLKLCIIATCMHLMEDFGHTVKEIEKDGFKIYERVDISYKEDTGKVMADSIGKAVSKFSRTFSRLSPDVIVVLGDRGEMLAASIAANYINIPVAHIHGGEVSGHVDGLLRHAITKLSHIHFPATNNTKERILRLGEEEWRIFLSGAPALDRILNEKLPSREGLLKKFGILKEESFFLLVQHPVSSSIREAEKEIALTLEAVKEFKNKTIVIYPNADAGGRKIIDVIKRYEKSHFIKTFKSIPHKDFLGLMKSCSVLIGNSSSGIIEAPSFKVPVVNIGIRQEGRERSTNVIDVLHEKDVIFKAIKKALYDKKFKAQLKRCENPYGNGHASERIVKVLSSIKLDERLLQKKITY